MRLANAGQRRGRPRLSAREALLGRGYATEAAAACLDAGFDELGLSVIVARAANANVASLRVLEKLGMRVRGPVQCHGMDSTLYVLTRDAWSQHPLASARS